MLFYLLAFLLIIIAATYLIGPSMVIRPQRSKCPIVTEDPATEAIKVMGEGGIELDGYWHHVDEPRAIILLLHGVGSCKEVWHPISEWLAQIGIETLAFDNRGHGRSGGKYTTFGYYEKKDVGKILDFIELRGGAGLKPGIAINEQLSELQSSSDYNLRAKQAVSPTSLPIGIFGNSLGGAISLQAMATDQRIRFGIIESTFTRLDEVVFAYMKRTSGGWGFKFISDLILKRAGKIANFNPDLVRPMEAVKSVFQPVFLAHGDEDIHINVANAHLNFANLASIDKEFVIVPGADHSGLNAAEGGEYEQKVVAFIERQLSKD